MKPEKKRVNNRRFPDQKGTMLIVAGAILLIGITIGLTLNHNREKVPVRETTPVVYDLATMEISKQFACSCGACNEKNLAVCTCPTAVSTKSFIESSLNDGISEDDIVQLVKDIYGHFKG